MQEIRKKRKKEFKKHQKAISDFTKNKLEKTRVHLILDSIMGLKNRTGKGLLFATCAQNF
jgi:arabinogalactan endo-1,4-beta-galactosidase